VSENPFIFGSPVRDRQHFFGREEILQRLTTRLRSMQDSSIIGERRIGKTSLLYHLHETDVAQQYGLDPSQYLFVYFSFEGAGQLTPSRFWQRLLRSLSEKIASAELRARVDQLRGQEEIDPFDVEDLFLEISDQGLRVVFLLDEFETVTQATSLDADFFSHLRSLATGRYIGLIFVTSSRQKLSELSHAGIVGSPFFNIFETFFLKPFRAETAEATLEAALAGTGVAFDQQEQAYLIMLSGRHPFFLQMAASYLFDTYAIHGLEGAQLRPARLERIEREFLTQAEPHFGHYWGQSTGRERIFLATLSSLRHSGQRDRVIDMEQLKQAYHEADIAARVLEDRGLVIRENGGYQIFSPLYERWIVEELTRSSGGGAGYQSWLARNEQYYGGALQTLYSRAEDVTASINPKYWDLFTEWLSRSDIPAGMIDVLRHATTTAANRPLWLRAVGE
jgi:hypothetical protein